MANDKNTLGLAYPLTKMNFVVSVDGYGTAAFSEVTGVEASVDVIEFRQGNAHSLAPVKSPGLVKHGNITLKYGMTLGTQFAQWVSKCVNDQRSGAGIERKTVTIELIDIREGAPSALQEQITGNIKWELKEAWVAKYSAPDLNASTSEVAIESVEIAYEELTIPAV